ncbi:MAG: aminotransferase class V-fold PLP-dependent enzyme [Planctomycetaceae bacterium]|nr:aminotransferase class V-fold PLP-dependent enzyme [Planctomycetaceae bacterium]
MRTIYLDHNATTPLLPEAAESMRHTEAEAYGNPASSHHVGRAARRALEDARERIAALLGAHPDEVTFTSGATEANNLAVFSLAASRVAASQLEHPCVIEPLRHLETRGLVVDWWPVNSRGIVAPCPVPPDTQLVCVMLANHETGAIQPVQAIARSLPPTTKLHCDAVQAVGKIPVNFRELGATTLTASAHKFGGPKGVGVLLTKRGTKLQPLLFGGHQQQGRRPGTESAPLAVGMATALDCSVRNMTANLARLEALRARLWERLLECGPVVLNGPEIGATDVVPTTLNVSFPGCRADLLLMSLDLAGVACSTGSACSSGSLLPSPVLRAMGIPEEQLRSALRFSLSPTLELTDIDEAATRIATVIRQMQSSAKVVG